MTMNRTVEIVCSAALVSLLATWAAMHRSPREGSERSTAAPSGLSQVSGHKPEQGAGDISQKAPQDSSTAKVSVPEDLKDAVGTLTEGIDRLANRQKTLTALQSQVGALKHELANLRDLQNENQRLRTELGLLSAESPEGVPDALRDALAENIQRVAVTQDRIKNQFQQLRKGQSDKSNL